MKLTHYIVPLLAAAGLAHAAAIPEPAPQSPQPPGPGQCQDVTCTNNDVCYGIGCGNCFITSTGGICLDPNTSKKKRKAEQLAAAALARRVAKPGNLFAKRDAEPEPAPQNPQPPAPGQCQDVACTSDDLCHGIGCGNCFITTSGGVCLDPDPVQTS